MTKREYKKEQQIIDDMVKVRVERVHNGVFYTYRKTYLDDLPSVTEIHKAGKG
jgi:hypothetical protein